MIKGLLSENIKVVSGLKPDADRLAGTQTSDYFKMSLYKKAMAVLDLGEGASGDTVVTVVGASASSFAKATSLEILALFRNAVCLFSCAINSQNCVSKIFPSHNGPAQSILEPHSGHFSKNLAEIDFAVSL